LHSFSSEFSRTKDEFSDALLELLSCCEGDDRGQKRICDFGDKPNERPYLLPG
jgi:hypothetical protein